MKPCAVEADLFYTDGRTDGPKKEIDVFRRRNRKTNNITINLQEASL